MKDYYDKVTNPMDLTTIKNKTKRNEYSNDQAFENDFKQIFINSEIYNGDETTSSITRQAKLVYEYAKSKINSRISEINEEVEKRNKNSNNISLSFNIGGNKIEINDNSVDK